MNTNNEIPEEVKFHDIPDYMDEGDLYTIAEWADCVECGGFIDYDGYGELAHGNQISDITIYPSDLKGYDFPEWATHILWFNR